MHWTSINMVCRVQDVLTCTVLSYADVYTADTCRSKCAISGRQDGAYCKTLRVSTHL
jgi:hypothetical protein